MPTQIANDAQTVARLVEDNLRLVYFVTGKFRNAGQFPHEDLIQEGCIGLVMAARHYDPSRGAFTTLACRAILNRLIGYSKQCHRANRLRVISESTIETTDRRGLNRYAGKEPAYTSDGELEEIRRQITTAMTRLTERERRVINMRFGIGADAMTLAEVGDVVQLTRERVRQIEAGALKKLRRRLATPAD